MTPRPTLAQLFVDELRAEAETTRRFLTRLPADKLAWRPHPKSHTAGELALHIAQIPGGVSAMALTHTFDVAGGPPPFDQPASVDDVLDAHDASVRDASARLAGLDDDAYGATWTMLMHGKPLLTMPRHTVVRTILLNQWIHHRGQFGVYLRLAGAAVPYSYGPSGDENPPFLIGR